MHSIDPLKLYYKTISKFKTGSLSSQKIQVWKDSSLVSLFPLKIKLPENKT